MSQGTAKKLVGQQVSADSDPVVLSSEQELILTGISGATTSIDNQLVASILNEGVATTGKSGMMLQAEDDSGNSEFLRSSAGNLYVRFASQPAVTAHGQYTEDAAAAADPNGTPVMLIRKDTPAAVTSADGDNVAQRGSNYGGAYTHILDSEGNISNIEAKLDQVLRQLKDRPELNYQGFVRVELQSTGTSPVTITSGAVTTVASLTTVGTTQTDLSLFPFHAINHSYYLATSQFLYS